MRIEEGEALEFAILGYTTDLTAMILEAFWRNVMKAKGQAADDSLAGIRAGYTCFLFLTPENMWAKRTSSTVASVSENRVTLSLLKLKFYQRKVGQL